VNILRSRDRHQLEKYFWLLMMVPTLVWWKESVLWVACMSLYANWKTADGAHEARAAQGTPEAQPAQGYAECDHCKKKAAASRVGTGPLSS
jgi:hypothetical protein